MSGADQPRLVGTCPQCRRPDVALEAVTLRGSGGVSAEVLWCVACVGGGREARARRLGDYPGGPAWW